MSSQGPQAAKKISKVRQACDCCHARKIRCNGSSPCLNCISTDLQCTYLAVPKKKGPKGRRIGRDALRKPINQVFNLPQPVTPQTDSTQASDSQTPEPAAPLDSNIFECPDFDIQNFQPSPFVSNEVMTTCLNAFFTHKYPITPILDREELFGILPHIHLYPEKYGLITACCAMIVLSPDIITLPKDEELIMPASEFLISETLRARQYCTHIETPTLSTVHTSFFLFSALFCLDKDNSAWFYIRESMTTLQLLRLHEEITYTNLTCSIYSTYARRTFWLLFLTERAYALQRHRPLTLQRTISLPFVNPTNEEYTILSGFLDLVSLFQNFDDNFLSLWNLPSEPIDIAFPAVSSSLPSLSSPETLLQLQKTLSHSLPHITQRTPIQQADLLISRQWLKTIIWQLCVTKNLLSSQTTNKSMSFHYPVTIARDVVLVSRQLPESAFEANGVGICEKLFDVGWALGDVLSLSGMGVRFGDGMGGMDGMSRMEVGPGDYMVELVRLLGRLAGGSSKYLSLLGARADECLKGDMRASLSSSGGEESGNRIFEVDDEETVDNEAVTGDTEMMSANTNFQHPIMRGMQIFGPEAIPPPAKEFQFPPYLDNISAAERVNRVDASLSWLFAA